MNTQAKINIAIDGHSSCGKGTLARYLANQLNYRFIDSGSMYRCVTLACLRNNVDLENEAELSSIMENLDIDFVKNEETGKNDTYVNGENVEQQIRSPWVAGAVSQVAKISLVRRKLVELQQKMGAEKGVVMDGRDIGTVVFPDAELKIFMTASAEIRAERRFKELTAMGIQTSMQEVLDNLIMRDKIDSTRADSPLTLNTDYQLLDNSELDIEAQNTLAMQWVEAALVEKK